MTDKPHAGSHLGRGGEIVKHWKKWPQSWGGGGFFKKQWQPCILTLTQKRTPKFLDNLRGLMTF